MRIAYLVNQYPQVSHTFIRREIAALEAAGHEVLRFSIRPPGADLPDPADRAEAARTAVLLDGYAAPSAALAATAARRPKAFLRALAAARRLAARDPGRPVAHAAYLAEACRLHDRLLAAGVDHLHAYFGTNPAAVAMLTRLLGGPPFSFTVHGPEEFDRPEALSLPEKIAAAEFVVGVSDFGRSQLMRWCPPARWGRVHVVRCGLDSAYLRSAPPPVPDNDRFVCVGRLAAQKGHLFPLWAVALLKRRGIACRVTLIGAGEMQAAIESEIAALGISDRVTLAGPQPADRVRAELLRSRALVLPSLAEGLPVALMEALAAGRPVITTPIAGIPELVRDGACGHLVAPGDARALADAMAGVLRTRTAVLTEMGATGARTVARRHDAAVEAARLAELFEAAAFRAGALGGGPEHDAPAVAA